MRTGIAYRGHNVSLLDGYDIGFTQLLFSEYLGAAVEYRPYPDYSSLCVVAPGVALRHM